MVKGQLHASLSCCPWTAVYFFFFFYAHASKDQGCIVLPMSVCRKLNISLLLQTIQATKLMFSMWIHVINAHPMRVICQRSRSNFEPLALTPKWIRLYKKVLLRGLSVSQTHLVLYLFLSQTTHCKLFQTERCCSQHF